MGNLKNKRKSASRKAIEKTRKDMAKDAKELSETDEEMHADILTPPPLPAGPSNKKHTRDSPSEEEDDEDDVSGEHPAQGRQQFDLLSETITQVLSDVDITFDYPTEGGMVDSITLPSSVSWVQFQEEMCTVMALRIKDLKLGYKFSTHPQREAPRVLGTPMAFIKMKDGAVAQICEQEKSTGKGKKVKSKEGFRVILIDSGKKTREKAAPTKGKVHVYTLSLFHLTNFVEPFKKANTTTKGPLLEEEEEPSEKGSGEFQSVLLSQYACAAHSRLCYPVSDTDHKALSHGDLGIWSTMIVCILVVICVVPSLTRNRLPGMQHLRTHPAPCGSSNDHLLGHQRNSQMPLPLLLSPLCQPMNCCSWNSSKVTHSSGLALAHNPDLIHSPLENAKNLHPFRSFSTTLQYIQNLTAGSRALITALEI